MSVTVQERAADGSVPVAPLGFIPESEFAWLEELRVEHPVLVDAWRAAVGGVAAVKAEQATLRTTYEVELAAAARSGDEPPALPARLDPAYVRGRRQAAQETERAALEALGEFVARVGSAVGQHRLSEKWVAATCLPEEEGEEPTVGALGLRRLEARWSWPPPRPVRATLDELEAEIAAADAVVVEIRRPMEERLVEWHRACAEHRSGAPKPSMPEFGAEDHQLGSAMERAARARAALDEARRMGRVA